MKCFQLSCIFSLACFLGCFADLNAWELPETGQSRCYNEETEILCPGPGTPFFGQDAQYRTGRRSFTKLDAGGSDLPDTAASWAMVRDNVTGLVWEVKTDDNTIHDVDNEYPDPEDRITFISALNTAAFGGFTDWRLPSQKELSYLLDRGRSDPSVDMCYFPLVFLYYYSSDADLSGSDDLEAYYVQFDTGYEYNFSKAGGSAMAVRGDGSADINIFADTGNGTIVDNQTGLVWQKHVPEQRMDWKTSLAYCEGLDLAGHSDWRLPNLYELQSIADYGTYGPGINTDYFPLTASAYFKTSTTIDSDPARAWIVDFNFGYVDFYFESAKTKSHYVRCVRSGLVPEDCFLETLLGAASAEAAVLRNFRDHVLAKHAVGRGLISLYYRLSPPVKQVLMDNPGYQKYLGPGIRRIVPLVSRIQTAFIDRDGFYRNKERVDTGNSGS